MKFSIAIMHHPDRAAQAAAVQAACAPLAARIVADPDPHGIPSPLRTAKKAWAAVDPDATHHLVLQDDVTLTDGFAGHIHRAVAAQPAAAITLYVNWHSTPNSYFVRRAVEAGAAWAPLFDAFVPTLGLVLPTHQARALAEYLAGIPDDIRHDDRVIAEFCRQRGIPVLAAVPHLLEHGALRSIAGNELDGERHATVFLSRWSAQASYWETAPHVLAASTRRAAHRSATDFSVELHNSETRLRFARPAAGEHIWHPFGWYWQDWCPLIGMDPVDVVHRGRQVIGRYDVPARLAGEIWAAGYILGFDSLDTAATGELRTVLLRNAFRTWLACGLLPEDQADLDERRRDQLIDIAVEAVAHGREPVLAARKVS
nr:hypothetical protein [Kibdelosporangium sp. MJ126-NF4]CEL20154.1 hypothetical protein [Kibdelosporangium sp. MJ126-NF4]CTQ97379.1 hypothetical protein [Kibdelosporangium sp. MJ126-NF4]